MGIQFLSEEWAAAVTHALNADPDFCSEARKRRSTVAWHIADSPRGAVSYHLAIDKGSAQMRLGEPATPADLNLSASYADIVRLSTGELDGRRAFQSKRLRADARLIAVLKYLGVFHAINRVAGALDIEY
jgi:putative sterol carrier protein